MPLTMYIPVTICAAVGPSHDRANLRRDDSESLTAMTTATALNSEVAR